MPHLPIASITLVNPVVSLKLVLPSATQRAR